MKRYLVQSRPWVRIVVVPGLLLIIMLAGLSLLFQQPPTVSLAQDAAESAFLPVQLVPEPTPTVSPTPTAGPPPQFVKNMELPAAQCPNAAGFNSVSNIMYIVNNFSLNVSVLQNREFVSNIRTGEWPTSITSDPQSARTWVTNLHSGTSLIEGAAQTGFIPRDYEPYGIAFNPVNGYVYVADLDSKVQIIDGTQIVTSLKIIDPQTGGGAGWLRPIVADSRTGLVYVASWDYGRLYVIKGTQVIDSVQLGWAPLNMAIDSARGLLYVAHSDPNATYPHDISVVNLATLAVTFVNPVPGKIEKARQVAVDVNSGFAYVTHPEVDTVTVLNGTQIVGTVKVGKQPWGIGVNPHDGYVFVTNRDSDDVSILRNGALLSTVKVQGIDPFAVGVDTNTNDIYIANRGRQVSVTQCKDASVTILR